MVGLGDSLDILKKVYIVYGGINLRSLVLIFVFIVKRVDKGAVYLIVGLSGKWYEVWLENG